MSQRVLSRRVGNLYVALCAVIVALLLSGSPVLAARGHVFDTSFGSEGTGNGQFKGPAGVAVNEETGRVYVVDRGNNRVQYFSSAGTYEGQFNGSGAPATFSGPEGIAVDNACALHTPALTASTTPTCKEFDPSGEDVYVVDRGNWAIDKFNATGAYLGPLTEGSPGTPFGEITGVAVDPVGGLWVAYKGGDFFAKHISNFDNAVDNTFIASCEVENHNVAYLTPGLAVDSQDNLYVEFGGFEGETGVAKFDSTCKVLSETVPPVLPEQATAVAVELSSNDSYIDNVTTVGRFSPSGVLLERLGSGLLTNGSGIGVNATAGEVYVADSAANTVDIFPLEPPGAPTVESESVSDVTSGSATLSAQINPRTESTEPDTTYYFQYGTVSCSANPTSCTDLPAYPGADIGSGFEVESVSVHPQDLLPDTQYYFRVVATNKHGTVAGKDTAFTTQTVGGALTLPDGRAWELVSPPDKHGALSQAISETGVIQAAADGDAMAYLTNVPTEAEPRGNANGVRVLSVRGSSGWTSKDIATPHNAETAVIAGDGEEYRFFSSDLSLALVEPLGEFTPLADCTSTGCTSEAFPEATERTPYLRHDFTCATARATCYEPLVTAASGYADVPPLTKFGGPASEALGAVRVRGATPDLSDVVLSSTVALTATPVKNALYEWAAAEPPTQRLQLVSVLPTSEGGAATGASLGYKGAVSRHAVSNDGSRIFFSSENGGEKGLYMRDTKKGETVRLDVQQVGGTAAPRFQTASADGSRVFFTDEQPLTSNSGASNFPSRSDLYECVIVEAAGKLACELTDLTPESSGERAEVQGAVLGASEDGSYVYFVANGKVASGAIKGNCETFHATDSYMCDLYMLHYDGKSGAEKWEDPKLIKVLSGADQPDWAGQSGGAGLGGLTSRVSPDGRWLAFMSDRPLTGYDNRDANSGKPDEEVFLYNAGTGPVCASCNPTGARPVGVEYSKINNQLVGGDRVWNKQTWLAANVPGWTPFELGTAAYQSRYLSDSGRLFFNSSDALVPQDINNGEDVYQYEPEGVGGCRSSSSTFSERAGGGCVDLISSGTSDRESAFLDASESGNDVFFLTAAKLAPQDLDTALDVYDAHVCSEASPCITTASVSPPPCSTVDSCRTPPLPQPSIFGAPPSATFSGTGNVAPLATKPVTKPLTRAQKLSKALKACRKKKNKRKRAACERQTGKSYGAKASGAGKYRKANASKGGRG